MRWKTLHCKLCCTLCNFFRQNYISTGYVNPKTPNERAPLRKDIEFSYKQVSELVLARDGVQLTIIRWVSCISIWVHVNMQPSSCFYASFNKILPSNFKLNMAKLTFHPLALNQSSFHSIARKNIHWAFCRSLPMKKMLFSKLLKSKASILLREQPFPFAERRVLKATSRKQHISCFLVHSSL